jgi:hypothetical protein
VTLPRLSRNVWPMGVKPRYRYNAHHRCWIRTPETHSVFPLYIITPLSTPWVRDGMPTRLS